MDRLFNATFRKTWLADDMLVRRPGHGRWRILVTAVALLLLGWTATVVISVCPPGLLRTAGSATIGAYIALVGMGYSKRLRAYKAGWIEGRRAMIQAFIETSRRGMTINDWLAAQAEQDAALMGVTIPERQWTEDDL